MTPVERVLTVTLVLPCAAILVTSLAIACTHMLVLEGARAMTQTLALFLIAVTYAAEVLVWAYHLTPRTSGLAS